MSEQDAEDCRRLNAVINEYNKRLPPKEWLTAADLARFAAPLGGSAYRQQWSKYRNGKLAIPFIDKMIFCLRIKERLRYSPQQVFPSWGEFAALTQLPPESLLPLASYLLTEQGRADTLLPQLLTAYLQTPPAERAKFRRAAGPR